MKKLLLNFNSTRCRAMALSLFLPVLLTACGGQGDQPLATVTLASGIAQKEKVVEIPYAQLAGKLAEDTTAAFKVLDAATGEEIPYQLEYRGEAEPVNLLVQVSMQAGKPLELELVPGQPASIAPKTFARYVPERMDDFAWENDKIAFRMYGKALEGTEGDAQGIDVWVKRTKNLIIDKWYESGDYHSDHGEGLDYYSVGMTLGAGDIVPFINDSLWFPLHYRKHEVLDNGPLRSTFRLGYEAWEVAGRSLKMSKLISIDAGSQLNRVEVLFSVAGEASEAAGSAADPSKPSEQAAPAKTTGAAESSAAFPVAIGIVQRAEAGEQLIDQEAGIMGYWEPPHGEDGNTGIGVLMEEAKEIKEAQGHLLAVVPAQPGKPLVYYRGAAWNKAGEITSASAWFDYLKNFHQTSQVEVKVN